MYHLGLDGWVKERVRVQAKFSYSQNFGTYGQPFEREVQQFSGLLRAEWLVGWLAGTTLSGSLAHDSGGLYPAGTGMYLSLRKTWH